MRSRSGLEYYKKAFVMLLKEFRKDSNKDEDQILKKILGKTNKLWDKRFPSFPEIKEKRRTISWEAKRGLRDKYLCRIIIRTFQDKKSGIIINPACVFGRYSRILAGSLTNFEVIGTDINSSYNSFYEKIPSIFRIKTPINYQFIQDNIFDSKIKGKTDAVVWFGACGSVTDGIIDYAIKLRSPFIIFRSCCHDNIGGNTIIKKIFNPINLFFRWKNKKFDKKMKEGKGEYFSKSYSQNNYPRSSFAKKHSNSSKFLEFAQNSVNSDICRSLIDLDRLFYLSERGYDVMYKEELFYAKKNKLKRR